MSAAEVKPPLEAVQSRIKKQTDSSALKLSPNCFNRLKGGREVTCRRLGDLDAFVLDNVVTAAECAYLIDTTESMGYSFWNTQDTRTDFRNADTIEVHHAELAALLWSRISTAFNGSMHISQSSDPLRWQRDLEGTWEPVGTNPRLLFARYKPLGHFAPHTDGFDIVGFDHRSMYSIVLFLNDCSEGGGTRFYRDEQRDRLVLDEEGRFTGQKEYEVATVAPKAGRMVSGILWKDKEKLRIWFKVVFYHNILHQGVALGPNASKYIIRSDVMYERTPPICTKDSDVEAFRLYQEAQELSNDGSLDDAMKLFRKAFKLSPKLADIYGM